jgi:hypothetical protein
VEGMICYFACQERVRFFVFQPSHLGGNRAGPGESGLTFPSHRPSSLLSQNF